MFKTEYDSLLEGIKKIRNHIFGVRFDGETAYQYAAKVMILVAGILCEINTIDSTILDQPLVDGPPYNRINRLKPLDADSFNVAATAIQILKKSGMII